MIIIISNCSSCIPPRLLWAIFQTSNTISWLVVQCYARKNNEQHDTFESKLTDWLPIIILLFIYKFISSHLLLYKIWYFVGRTTVLPGFLLCYNCGWPRSIDSTSWLLDNLALPPYCNPKSLLAINIILDKKIQKNSTPRRRCWLYLMSYMMFPTQTLCEHKLTFSTFIYVLRKILSLQRQPKRLRRRPLGHYTLAAVVDKTGMRTRPHWTRAYIEKTFRFVSLNVP